MRKKILSYLAFILITLSCYGQGTINSQMSPISKQYFVSNQADSRDRSNSNLAIDGDISTSTLINNEHGANWWQLNTKFVRKIAGVKIEATDLNQFYIFISKAPFNHVNLNSLLQDPWVKYTYVNSLTEQIIPITGLGQYAMILPVNEDAYYLNEVSLYGFENEGPNDPQVGPPYVVGPPLSPPYGTCGPWWWPPNNPPICPVKPPYIIGPPFKGPYVNDDPWNPWWSNWEICGNGIDDDGNGLTDCEDYPCGVGWYNSIESQPTCRICNDGQICIYSYPPVTQVSIDGGVTWTSVSNPTGETCFSNLGEGTYEVILKTKSECRSGERITLATLRGGHDDCVNGGFEEGSFSNWTGGIISNYSSNFNNTTIVVNDRHSIIQNPFTDPFVPFIQGFQGIYTGKLGNSRNGAESERLTYCFIVDNDNKDFSFNYATVLETPGHSEQLPYFQYRIFEKLNGNQIALKKTNTDDPFLTTVSNNIQALGWQCVDADLSALIDKEVCVEFISSDCGCGAHFGYGYIDGLCNKEIFTPDIDLISNDVYCINQPIEIIANGVGFNQFRWIISKVDVIGNEYDLFTSPVTIGFEAKIEDVKEFYESNTSFYIECPQRLKIKFEAISDCGTSIVDKEIDYVCSPQYIFDYCDPLYYCVSANQNQIQIQGENNCTDCKYEWGSNHTGGPLGLVNRFSKYPLLDRSIAWNAWDKRYFVNVETPEGCKYYDEFQAESNKFEINILEIDYGYCSYKVVGSINFDSPIDISAISATATNIHNNTTFPLVLTQDGAILNFDFAILRNELSRIKIEVKYFNENCEEGNCAKTLLLDAVNAPFHSQWKAEIPNAFSPNGDGLHDEFYIQFRSVNEDMENCFDMNWSKSSIHFYRLRIFDEWGNLMFEDEVDVGLFDTRGVLGDEIKWDGKFNGTPLNPDTYTWQVTVESCYDGSNQCNDCTGGTSGPNGLIFEKCGTSGFEIFAGPVDIIL